MSTILAIELFQARCDAAIASSKLLLNNSCHELRNAPINSQQLFDKKIAKSNYEAQQHRFLASSISNANIQQQQNSSFSATGLFKKPRQPTISYRPKQNQLYRSKTQSQSYTSNTKKDFSKRSSNTKQFPSSQSSESQPFPLPILPHPDIPMGGRLAHFVEQWGELT